jgi:hypothetical protein
MLVQVAIGFLSVGSFLDGFSTNAAIKRGAHESDPIMVWIFGTAIPTAKTVYVRGGI